MFPEITLLALREAIATSRGTLIPQKVRAGQLGRRSLNETSASLLASQARRESGLLTQPFAKLAK